MNQKDLFCKRYPYLCNELKNGMSEQNYLDLFKTQEHQGKISPHKKIEKHQGIIKKEKILISKSEPKIFYKKGKPTKATDKTIPPEILGVPASNL